MRERRRDAASSRPSGGGWRLRRAGVAITALVAGCGGGAVPDSDAPAQHDLVFDSSVDGQQPARLYRSDLSGGPPQPVAGGVVGGRATAHPSGALLLYSAADNGSPGTPPVLQALDLATGRVRRLSVDTAALEGEPAVSPDGAAVAFVSQREDPGGDIVVARLVDGALVDRRNLTPVAAPVSEPDRTPAWSPDGRRIAFTAYRDGSPTIWTMDRDGHDARPLTPAGNWGDFSPSWSPDGQLIAFQRTDGGPDGRLRSRIGIVPAAGGPLRWLALPHNAYDPRFSPDGRQLALSLKTEDGGDIAIVALDGTLLQRIGTPGIDRHPAWLRRR